MRGLHGANTLCESGARRVADVGGGVGGVSALGNMRACCVGTTACVETVGGTCAPGVRVAHGVGGVSAIRTKRRIG